MSQQYIGLKAPQQPLDHLRLAPHIEANSRDTLRRRASVWPSLVLGLSCVGVVLFAIMGWR